MTPDRIKEAVRVLAGARPPGAAIDALPEGLAPADAESAWAIHQALVGRLGPVAGWKTGAPTPEAEPVLGEITRDTIHGSPARMPYSALRLWAVEAEIAVTFARGLPARATPYDAHEVLGAVGSWHAAIEVLDTAFSDWKSTPALSKLADRQSHGALVLGPASGQVPPGSLATLPVRLLIDGATVFAHEGGNTAGDPTLLLVKLANRLAATDRPVAPGDVVTTGSTTPFHRAEPGQRVRAEFAGLAAAELAVEG